MLIYSVLVVEELIDFPIDLGAQPPYVITSVLNSAA
jgi:hypothetical protein